jgi:hypothetical protein
MDRVKAAEVLLPQFRDRHDLMFGDLHSSGEPVHPGRDDREPLPITRGNEKEVKTARHRIYTTNDHVLEKAGFTEAAGFRSLGGTVRLGSPRLALAAIRTEVDSP